MSVTKNPVLPVVATDVFCFEELVWLVWPVLEEAVVMQGSFLVTEDLGSVEKDIVLAHLGCTFICELGKWIVSSIWMGRKVVVWKWD